MYCVIVGDIINSRSLDNEVRGQVTKTAKNTFERINAKYMSSLLATFGLVRGDGFEGILLSRHYAPQIVQDILKAIYRVEKTMVRISIVTGRLTITSQDRNENDGEAFSDAIKALFELKKLDSKHWLQVSFDIGTLGRSLIDSQIRLITALTERWTDKQREMSWVAEEIEGHEIYQEGEAKKQELYKLVAKRIGSTPAIVKKQLNAASYEAYKQAWDGLTEYLIDLDEYSAGNKDITQESYLPYYNVAERKLRQYNYEDALPLLEKAIALARDELKEDDTQLILLYNSTVIAYAETGEHCKAEIAIQKSFDMQKSMPKTRQEYVNTLFVQTKLHLMNRDYDNAKLSANDTLAIAQDIFSQTHPSWSAIYNDLAIAYSRTNDYESALNHYEKSLHYEITSSLIDHGVTLSNIALCYKSLEDYKQAINNAEKALGIFEEALPQNHRYIKETRNFIQELKSQEGEL